MCITIEGPQLTEVNFHQISDKKITEYLITTEYH